MKKNLKLLSLLLAIALLFTACGSAAKTEQPVETEKSKESEASSKKLDTSDTSQNLKPKYGGILKISVPGEPLTLDLHVDGNLDAQVIGMAVFETVLVSDDTGEIYPMLCDYELKEDGKVIELKLRENVKFHNGDIMDAGDVKASLERWLTYASFGKRVIGSCLEEIEIVDDLTVRLKLSTAPPLALTALAFYDEGPYVMPKEIIEAAGDSNVSEFIGTGPYKFVEWQADRHILLKKFEDYQAFDPGGQGIAGQKYGYSDEIYFIPAKDNMTAVNGLKTGEYDVVCSIEANIFNELRSISEIKTYVKSNGVHPGLVFNYKKGLISQDEKLRQAIFACLDMDQIMYGAHGSEDLYILQPSWMTLGSKWATDAGADLYNEINIEKAKKLLEESNYNGETLIYLTTKAYGYFYKSALMVSELCKRAGINIEVQAVDKVTLKQYRMDPDKYDMFSLGSTAKPDPSLIAFLQDGWAGFYDSEAKKKFMAKFTTEADTEKRFELWDTFTREVLYKELPVISFGENMDTVATSERVENIFTGTINYYWNMWINE